VVPRVVAPGDRQVETALANPAGFLHRVVARVAAAQVPPLVVPRYRLEGSRLREADPVARAAVGPLVHPEEEVMSEQPVVQPVAAEVPRAAAPPGAVQR
jgi:hypothetical protein